jgi:hypothetical protein
LGTALAKQGISTGGTKGTALLVDAATALRNALEVYTRENLPQTWATTQSNLANVLCQLGIWSTGAEGVTLLAEAATLYRSALEVKTRDYAPWTGRGYRATLPSHSPIKPYGWNAAKQGRSSSKL